MTKETFGRWLDLTLSNAGITNNDLAEAVGAHFTAVSKWKTGHRIPSARMLARIAKFLDLDPARLMVTAGLVEAEDLGVEPYPMPPPNIQRAAVRRQLDANRNLTPEMVERMLEAYDRAIREQSEE